MVLSLQAELRSKIGAKCVVITCVGKCLRYQALMAGPVTERQPSIRWGPVLDFGATVLTFRRAARPAGGGRAGAVVWVRGRRERERAQAGVDEPGGAADVGADQFMDPGRCGAAVQVLAQALGLDVPPAEQGPRRDLRLGVLALIPARAARSSPPRTRLVHHVALVGAQRGCDADQVAEPADRLAAWTRSSSQASQAVRQASSRSRIASATWTGGRPSSARPVRGDATVVSARSRTSASWSGSS